jgi:hypothetical protein
MWLFNVSSSKAQTQEPIKGDVKVDHAIMGGVRAMPEKKDTTKASVHPTGRPIKGKVKIKEPQMKSTNKIKMGEVEAVPDKIENAKPVQSKSKK